jgi:hypothetical protein
VPRIKNGPVRVKIPLELGRIKRAGNSGNKTQAIVLNLIKRLLEPPQGSSYHIYFNNPFVFTRIIKYARSQGIGITSTCKDNKGVIQELLDFKMKDKKDVIK